jgi:hypothetical protein
MFLDFEIIPDGQCHYKLVSSGTVVASDADRLKVIHIAMKRIRQVAVKGPVVIRIRGIDQAELQDRLWDAKRRWQYPEWWCNCEWQLT